MLNIFNNFNLFPLTVLQNKIHMEEDERTILVNEIKKMQSQKIDKIKSSYAWTGDTKGYNFYFQILCLNLSKISIIIEYLNL